MTLDCDDIRFTSDRCALAACSAAMGVVGSVDPDSPAFRAGIVAGDRIVAADGASLADVIDWQWFTADTEVTVTIADNNGMTRDVLLTRAPGESLGIVFTSPIFDSVRTCRNACTFCFIAQLPKGLRSALYVRDDDFRLSFLQGNFITLTNFEDADVERIARQQLSPLRVSLHAVDPDLRRRLLCASEDRVLERIDQLLDFGIDLHVQIVLVPGLNDGQHLDETLTWLAEREGVVSVGIVPLGYTAHQSIFARSYEDPHAALKVIQQVQRWQLAMRQREKVTWVHLADEFYLNARAPFPTTEWYDGFPQYENGIGLVRSFIDEVIRLRTELEAVVRQLPVSDSVTLVTGMMASTILAGALEAVGAAGRIRLLVVPNRFFGGNVSVAGLLTGRDIADAIRADPMRESSTYVLPDIIFNADGFTLDDYGLDDHRAGTITLASAAEARVLYTTADAAGLLAGVQRAAV